MQSQEVDTEAEEDDDTRSLVFSKHRVLEIDEDETGLMVGPDESSDAVPVGDPVKVFGKGRTRKTTPRTTFTSS